MGLPTYNHIQLSFCLGLTINSEIDIILVKILWISGIDLIVAFLSLCANLRDHTWNSTALSLGINAISRAWLNYLRLSLMWFKCLLLSLWIVAVWVEWQKAVVNQHFVILMILTPTIILSLLLSCKRKMLVEQIIIFNLQICILLLCGLILTTVEDVEIDTNHVVFLLFWRSVLRDLLWASNHATIALVNKFIISGSVL